MTASPHRVAVALGSNMNDRFGLLESGMACIASLECVTILAMTSVEETVALGVPQAPFLNQMVLLDCLLSLPALLAELQAMEHRHGRERTVPKGPRTLDLDIVWAKGITVTSRELLVPHPGLLDRDFWQRELSALVGVAEAAEAIAAARIHAGMDTIPDHHSRHERRWTGGWDAFPS